MELENKPTYTLGKNERLKSRKAIEELFTAGKSFSIFPFKVIYSKTPNNQQLIIHDHLKCAFSVSKRHFKKAVERNRIKRLMREAYRLQKIILQSQLEKDNNRLAVFILYVSNEMPEQTVVFSKIEAVIKRLQKIAHEETVAHI